MNMGNSASTASMIEITVIGNEKLICGGNMKLNHPANL
jgi:hypothetical protein